MLRFQQMIFLWKTSLTAFVKAKKVSRQNWMNLFESWLVSTKNLLIF